MVKTVLMVDDDKASIKLFETLLQSLGCNTIVSCDGIDALQLVQKHHPDLILMDIRLPHISGIELTKVLKANDDSANIPVLAVTALAMESDKESIFEAGCDGYLTKPISIGDFLVEIKKYMGLNEFRIIESLKTGHIVIDSEHEQIMVLLNDFSNFQDARDDQGCAKKLTELSKTMKSHIKNEERIMAEHEYDKLEAQEQAHICIMNKLDNLISSWSKENNNSAFTDALKYIFIEDFFNGDMDFANYLQSRDY